MFRPNLRSCLSVLYYYVKTGAHSFDRDCRRAKSAYASSRSNDRDVSLENLLVQIICLPPILSALKELFNNSHSPRKTKASIFTLVLLVLDIRSVEQCTFNDLPLPCPNARSLRSALQELISSLPTSFPKRSFIKVESWDRTYFPTAEQAAIANLPLRPGISRISALAGTGKTTSIRALFRKNSTMQKEGLKKVYVVFNNLMAAEACEYEARVS